MRSGQEGGMWTLIRAKLTRQELAPSCGHGSRPKEHWHTWGVPTRCQVLYVGHSMYSSEQTEEGGTIIRSW